MTRIYTFSLKLENLLKMLHKTTYVHGSSDWEYESKNIQYFCHRNNFFAFCLLLLLYIKHLQPKQKTKQNKKQNGKLSNDKNRRSFSKHRCCRYIFSKLRMRCTMSPCYAQICENYVIQTLFKVG